MDEIAMRAGPLKLLPRFLFETDGPRWLYALKAWPLALLPSMALAAVLTAASDAPPQPAFGTGIGAFLAVVVLAPLAETLLMAPAVLILRRLLGPAVAVIGSAILWGVLHSLAEPGWGLVIWWPFLIFSTVLLVWRDKGLGAAILTAAAVHALQNLLPGLTLLSG